MFLAILKRKVVDTKFQPAIEGDLKSNPPIAAVAEQAEKSHLEVAKVFIEPNHDDVKRNIENKAAIDYYNIRFSASLKPTLEAWLPIKV